MESGKAYLQYFFLFLHNERVEVSPGQAKLSLLEGEGDHLLPVVHRVQVEHRLELPPDLLTADLIGAELTAEFL